VIDVIGRSPGPLWLALEDNNPGIANILRAAQKSGKVRLVLLWGNGKGDAMTGDTGINHRDIDKGGSRVWIRGQDRTIAEAVGMGR